MPEISEDLIREKLKEVKYPGFSRDIVSFGLIKNVWIEGGQITVKIALATRDPQIPDQILRDVRAALEPVTGADGLNIDFDISEPAQQAQSGGDAPGGALPTSEIPGVRQVIAVASGKGGVGKSTVATNLAVALAQTGAKVGLCDCDLYGPSMGLMFGIRENLMANTRSQILPAESFGVKVVSMGLMLGSADAPAIVRGPLATRYIQQFLRQCDWGELDYLVLDLPPGTGDIQLTIVQTVALAGAVIVTTPQEVALIDARKAVSMFEKVNVPILGIVENMSWFECAHGERYAIFGEGGGKKEAERLGVPLLGQIPIDIPTRDRSDRGEPVALLDPAESAVSAAFHSIAASTAAAIAA
ncbi:MAG: Mrp/NBP35 family ATP-binding protein [Verrucomicrobiae bacterium]|nr:Mrp/NBP35 family ATP-binding protein [Verrucomicrobiae bacterium]